ncbi:MAG: EpsG family protein [Eggerthellaceae bacterium]|nr:EpsG family protein [Eggerthellaceae bacterium]
MTVYIIAWGLCLLALVVNRRGIEEHKTTFMICLAGIMLFIFGFRDTAVGTDTAAYLRYLNLYQDYSIQEILLESNWFRVLEPGFVALIKIANQLNLTGRGFLVFIALVYVGLLCSFIARLRDDERYWVLFCFFSLYFPFFGLNAMRQALACLVIMHTFIDFRDSNYKRMVLEGIIAVLLHKGAIVPFGIMILFSATRNAVPARYIQILTIFGSLIVVPFYGLVLGAINYTDYLGIGISEHADISLTKLILVAIVILLTLINNGSIQQSNTHEKRASQSYVFVSTMIALTLITTLAGGLSEMFIRVSQYCLLFLCYRLSELAIDQQEDGNDIETKHIVLGCILICLTGYFFFSLSINSGGIVPFAFGGIVL